jgi:hypothetical protein
MLKNVARPALSFATAQTLLPVDLTRAKLYPGDPGLGHLHLSVLSTETNSTLILGRARTTSTFAFT